MSAGTEPGCEAAWRTLIRTIMAEGATYRDQEGRACKELRDITVRIGDAGDAKRLVERLRRQLPWLYPTTEELRSVFFSMNSVASGYSYAPRLFGESDQVDGFVIPLLTRNPESRRAVVVPYDPLVDSRVDSSDIPSVLALAFRRLDHGLAVTATMRSVDAFLGFPANAYQLRCLQEYVAERLGVPCAELTLVCVNAHWLPEYDRVAKAFAVSEQETGRI